MKPLNFMPHRLRQLRRNRQRIAWRLVMVAASVTALTIVADGLLQRELLEVRARVETDERARSSVAIVNAERDNWRRRRDVLQARISELQTLHDRARAPLAGLEDILARIPAGVALMQLQRHEDQWELSGAAVSAAAVSALAISLAQVRGAPWSIALMEVHQDRLPLGPVTFRVSARAARPPGPAGQQP